MTITPQKPAHLTGELFAVEFAALAREIAMDILPIDQILQLHRMTDEEWLLIQSNPRFQAMLLEKIREWNAAASTRDRVKIKAATGLEAVVEIYIREIANGNIPLNQRVEAGKFLARLGELDGAKEILGGGGGGGFSISINIGDQPVQVTAKPHQIIEGELAE